MKRSFILLSCLFCNFYCIVAQQSPFGTGQINDQNIGQLDDPSVVVPSQSGYGFNDFFPDAQESLQNYTFDIYVPEDYDGSEAYGLVVFINSGNNGGFKSQWHPVLDERKLIWISGDQIGNSIYINIRMGVAMAGALRMQELFNIDTNRIYTSGNSGGARMGHNLAFIYPETFKGAMPSCGGSYIRQVDQDYETQQPDGHYEAILNYPANYLDYLLPFDQRFANLTSYDDFREGDIMNIYHNGSEIDGLKGKFLETAGGHCSTTTEHFRDALNFVEHPFYEVIQENFEATTEVPFEMTNAMLASPYLQLEHNVNGFAQVQSKDLFLWDDPMGVILETSIQLPPNSFNSNTRFHQGIWSMGNPTDYCGFIGNELQGDIPAILLTVDFSTDFPTLNVSVNNPEQPTTEVLFTSTFTDWDITQSLDIKYHLWGEELRIELGSHLATPTAIETGVRLLDDNRSIRIRWSEMTTDFWSDTAWSDGAFLTLLSEKNDASLDATNLFVDRLELITANTDIATGIPNSSNSLSESICMGDSYEFNGQTITDAGTYEASLVNALGCDSLVTLDLTVNALPEVTISESNDAITTNMTFESYQWYFDGQLLPDETGATINPTESGEYYVIVTNANGCNNISNTINYTSTSLVNLEAYGIVVSPNPTQGNLIIEANGHHLKTELFDLSGKLVMTDLKAVNDLSHLENGLYILKIQVEDDIVIVKVQKAN